MNRKEFLKGAGLAGLAFTIPGGNLVANKGVSAAKSGGCELIPVETEGPYPLDLTENNFFLRQDVTEGKSGAQLNLRMRILGSGNCLPMQNVRVNIWHCDATGNYSGYGTESGETYLRGYQFTDADGECEFVSIFPGWYPGRVCHIHFQVYVSQNQATISQLTWDHDLVNEAYNANPDLYPNGEDPMTPNTDNIFNDGYALQIASLTPNTDTGGYDAFLEVTVNGDGAVGVSNYEIQAAKVFELGQNSPNPFVMSTKVPVTLHQRTDISLDLYDLNGKKVAQIYTQKGAIGSIIIPVNLAELGLPAGNYIYQLEAVSEMGTFRIPKMMTHRG